MPIDIRNLKLIALLCILTAFSLTRPEKCVAQHKKIPPLFSFLQDSADSTMVLSFTNNWDSSYNFYILSKKGDTINMYTYRYQPPVKVLAGIDVPKRIAKRITKVNMSAYGAPPDVNAFFEVKVLAKDSLKSFWRQVLKADAWQMKDDSTDGEGCLVNKGNPSAQIFDGGGLSFYVITASEMKELKFYAPAFYEQHCPGRPGRISALKVSELFYSFFEAAGEKEIGKLRKFRYSFKNG